MKIELRNIIHIDLAKRLALLVTIAILATARAEAQTDSIANNMEPLEKIAELPLLVNDTVLKVKKPKRDWSTWSPDPQRALWLALVIPGGGQIYNRKYWKLPIFYGGFLGCAYAMRWNNQMYADYAQAYIDIMDDNPNTNSFNQFLHLGSQITDQNIDRYKELFRKRKDRFRRWRDLSFFCMIGVYGLSIIDAYVDASLSQFDISDDLSLRLEPGFVNSDGKAVGNRNKGGFGFSSTTGVGINAALTF